LTNLGINAIMIGRYIHGPNVHIHMITDDSVCLSGMCTSGKYHEMVVDKQNLIDYNSGALIQDAFPTLNASEREFLLTGMCCSDIWNSELT
jgi:hypothetical protein